MEARPNLQATEHGRTQVLVCGFLPVPAPSRIRNQVRAGLDRAATGAAERGRSLPRFGLWRRRAGIRRRWSADGENFQEGPGGGRMEASNDYTRSNRVTV